MRIIGIDIGATYIKAGVVLEEKVIHETKIPTPLPQELSYEIIELAKELDGDKLGVGMPGLVTEDGIVYSPPNLPGIERLPLKEILEKELKIPVRVSNDANCVALGEWKYGAGKGKKNLIVLTLGTGVGGGLIIDGKLYTGRGFAGEVGHITIEPNGPLCRCGNYGCLEAFVGSDYMVERTLKGINLGVDTSLSSCTEITPEDISEHAKAGDRFAKDIIEEVGYYLGTGIANLASILDPEIVIVGGGVSNAGEILFNRIRNTVQRRLYTRNQLDIVCAELGDKGGILGSALYAKLF
jgi:glucokinase